MAGTGRRDLLATFLDPGGDVEDLLIRSRWYLPDWEFLDVSRAPMIVSTDASKGIARALMQLDHLAPFYTEAGLVSLLSAARGQMVVDLLAANPIIDYPTLFQTTQGRQWKDRSLRAGLFQRYAGISDLFWGFNPTAMSHIPWLLSLDEQRLWLAACIHAWSLIEQQDALMPSLIKRVPSHREEVLYGTVAEIVRLLVEHGLPAGEFQEGQRQAFESIGYDADSIRTYLRDEDEAEAEVTDLKIQPLVDALRIVSLHDSPSQMTSSVYLALLDLVMNTFDVMILGDEVVGYEPIEAFLRPLAFFRALAEAWSLPVPTSTLEPLF